MSGQILVLAACVGLVGFGRAFCQQTDPPPASGIAAPKKAVADSPEASGPAVTRSNLESFYLKDKDGKLVQYFDIPFEDFERVYNLYKQLEAPDRPPRFILQNMSLSGVVEDGLARLDVAFRIRLEADGWVRVPLRLNHAVMQQPDEQSASADQTIEYFEDGDGYVVRLRGEAGKSQTVKLKMLTRVSAIGDESELLLRLPSATTSHLDLVVPGQGVTLVPADNRLDHPPVRENGNRTKLSVEGISNDVRLTWRQPPAARSDPRPQLGVFAAVVTRIEAPENIRGEATITVRSFADPFSSFLVRLPPNMRLVPVEQPGVTTTELKANDARIAELSKDCRFVEVKLRRATTGPEEIRLFTKLAGPAQTSAPLEFGGFEVLGAVDQTGTMDFVVSDGWLVQQWTESGAITRAADVPDAQRREGVTARFSVAGFPNSLTARIERKEQRVQVDPSYVIEVEPGQLKLTAKLKYRIGGAKVTSLSVDLTGWQITRLGDRDSGWIKTADVDLGVVSPLKVPLVSPDESSSEFELTIEARQTIAPGTDQLSFSIPQPVEGTRAVATVVVVPADNVDVSPLTDQLQGLVSTPLPSSVTVPATRQTVYTFRTTNSQDVSAESSAIVFAGQFMVKSRSVVAECSGTLTVVDEEIHAAQDFTLRVEYEPLGFVVLAVPRNVLDNHSLRVWLDANELSPVGPTDPATSEDGSSPVRFDFPKPRIGTFQLRAEFRLPLVKLVEDEATRADVPLVTVLEPAESRITLRSLDVIHDESLHIESGGQQWLVSDPTRAGGTMRRSFNWQGAGGTGVVPLNVTLLHDEDHQATLVQRVWVQSWIHADQRQDRAAFRLVTDQRQFEVRLPQDARLDDIAVQGQRITGVVNGESSVMIDVPDELRDQEFVLELWYSFPDAVFDSRNLGLRMPRIIGTRWTKQLYWQLVVPKNQHLVGNPAGMTPELTWDWREFYWGRQARLSQRDLEQWVGATRQSPVPAETNQYVFSSFGAVGDVKVMTLDRRTILFAGALSAFAFGLLLVYVPAVRHPVILIGLGAATIGLGVVYPELAIQIAQVAALGIGFVLIVFLLRTTIAKPRAQHAIIRGTSLAGLDTTEVQLPGADRSSHASAASTSLVIQLASPESKS